MKKKLGLAISVLLSAAMLAGLVYLVDWGDARRLISLERWPLLALGAALFFVTLVLRGIRFGYVLRKVGGADIGNRDAFDIAAMNNLGNHLLPMRLGEVLFLFLAQVTHKIPVERATCALLVARIGDMSGLLLTLTLGALGLPGIVPWPVTAALATGFVVAFGISLRLDAFVAFASSVLGFLLGRVGGERVEGNAIARKAAGFLRKLSAAAEGMRSLPVVLGNFVLSVTIWAALQACFFTLLLAFGLELSVPRVILGSSGAALLPMLPVNAVGTLGPLEAGWTAGFVAMGMESSDAAASGLLMHGVVIAVSALTAQFALLRLGPGTLRGFDEWRRRDRAT